MSQEPREGTEEVEDRPTSDEFGPWLRRQREIRQIELQEIADRTKISVRYLRAMEQDRFDLLPGAVFTRGFLREYARYVGLNPDEVVNFYLSTREDDSNDGEDESETPARKSGFPVWRIVLGILLLAAVVFLGWFLFRYVSGDSADDEPPPARAAAPAPSTEAPEPAEPAPRPVSTPPGEPGGTRGAAESQTAGSVDAALEVTLDFREDCWLEARIDGNELLSQRFAQGESLQLEARERVELLTLGNAGGVSVRINGMSYPLDASDGEVLRNVTLDLETARRLEERGR